ncbi:hypothetical protein [Pseudoalteromonas luteoviolacea]|uniref:Uncharacterized protein n=1 Tax=Pseudoalteromonas luteoviolacea S4060-1 TaxID=1365257 RepID=A0A162BWM2_9GAMM|nr:hypothetical protein [Pseudoalteromonas luteoviolacea]KZN70326.1 hypothetical protein N478_00050 [Pseudoalteromonas luteoviolacea S4060-1]
MKYNFPPCVYAETLLELPKLSELDIRVAKQYLPMIVEYYSQRLLLDEKAHDYLYVKYGISPLVSRHYSLGYSDRTLGAEFSHTNFAEREILRGSLKRLRLFRGSGHEAFVGCVVVPILVGESITGFYAERIARVCRNAKPFYRVRFEENCLFVTLNFEGQRDAYFCDSPLAAIQLCGLINKPAFATDRSFELNDQECEYMRKLGVQDIIILKPANTLASDMSKVRKKLTLAGFRSRIEPNFLEVKYGKA